MKNVFMKTASIGIALSRWPYGLELETSAKGLLLHARRKARANWSKAFRTSRTTKDDLAATRQLANEFDAGEWKW
jgi:hypothetical protein